MLRFRQKWPDAAECCGSEVQTNRLVRKRAWWAQGAAIEKFEEDIQPEIEAILENVELSDPDIYFRVYMIGRTQEGARPTIMICCADVSTGRRAKESLRHSSVMRRNPGFCLGSIDFPLEQLVPVRRLTVEVKLQDRISGTSSHSTPDIDVFAISSLAKIGRQLFVAHPQTMEVYRHSTGGVVITAHGKFYQLTVGHITDHSDVAHQPPRLDPDACSFDGQSDSDFGDEVSVFEQDMRRASASVFNLSESASSDAESEKTEPSSANYRSPSGTDYITTNTDATGSCRGENLRKLPLVRAGTIILHSKDGDKPNLDYALIAIQPPTDLDLINVVIPGTRDDTRAFDIHDFAAVGREERRVILVTGSGGVMKGTLVPRPTFLGRGNQKSLQKLYVVESDSTVAEGDSGAAVIDGTSGSLYGHIVSGCPGTHIAYIVAATDIFQALESELQGPVTIVAQNTIQSSPIEPPNISSLPQTSSCTLEEPDQLPNCTTLNEIRVSSGPSDEQGILPNTTELVTASGYSVLDAQISKLQAKFESLAIASQSLEQYSSYRRKKKPKKTGYRQRRHPRAVQGVRTYEPPLRKFGVEPEGSSTCFTPQEKSQASIERAMKLENNVYMDDVDSDDELDKSLLTLLFDRLRAISHRAEFTETGYDCCSLRELQRRAYFSSPRKTCLLDDRTNDGINSVSLGYYKPLSVESLYQKLRDQRLYPPRESSLGPEGHKSTLPGQEALPLSADRRLIYIQDIDSYGIAVLIATASRLQAKSLGHILYKYLEFQSGISLSFKGHFHLSFCLPTYVWRTTRRRPQDGRSKRSGEPLRAVRDVSFLGAGSVSKSNNGEVDYLCEAQTSISITGVDSCHWTGLCLVDTYYQAESQREDLSDYCAGDEDSLRLDSFSHGELDADRPYLDPREYFLCVLDSRARCSQLEWQYVAFKLQLNIERYISTFPYTSNTTPVEVPDFNKGLDWFRETKHLLLSLILCLERTINHWDYFMETEKFHSELSLRCLKCIQQTFCDARLSVHDLKGLSAACDEHARAIELAMISERLKYLRVETKLWKNVQTLKSFLMFVCYPTLLAAAMLSMSEKATPSFLGPNKFSFFVLSPVLIAVAFVLGSAIHRWDWVKDSLCQLAKNIQVCNLERLPRSNSDRRFPEVGLA